MDFSNYSMQEAKDQMGHLMGPWCACGRSTEDDPWDLLEENVNTFAEAIDVTFIHVMGAREKIEPFTMWYIDREDNEGIPFAFVDIGDSGTPRVQFS